MIDDNINDLPAKPQDAASGQINDFINKYRGALIIIISAAMIALIIFLLLNISFLKALQANPVEYCQKAGCYCMNQINLP
jgi:hypothetical protein